MIPAGNVSINRSMIQLVDEHSTFQKTDAGLSRENDS